MKQAVEESPIDKLYSRYVVTRVRRGTRFYLRWSDGVYLSTDLLCRATTWGDPFKAKGQAESENQPGWDGWQVKMYAEVA